MASLSPLRGFRVADDVVGVVQGTLEGVQGFARLADDAIDAILVGAEERIDAMERAAQGVAGGVDTAHGVAETLFQVDDGPSGIGGHFALDRFAVFDGRVGALPGRRTNSSTVSLPMPMSELTMRHFSS